VWQRCDLDRDAMLCQGACNLLLPDGRPYQAVVETIGLAQLKTDPLDRLPIIAGHGVAAEGMQDAPFMRRQRIGVAGRESTQQRRVMRLCLGNAPLALRGGRGRIETQHFVDQAKIPVVVQQSLVGGDFRVDPDPEPHVALEFGRMHERIGDVGGGCTAAAHCHQQQTEGQQCRQARETTAESPNGGTVLRMREDAG
jgi:hypothetical protein